MYVLTKSPTTDFKVVSVDSESAASALRKRNETSFKNDYFKSMLMLNDMKSQSHLYLNKITGVHTII